MCALLGAPPRLMMANLASVEADERGIWYELESRHSAE